MAWSTDPGAKQPGLEFQLSTFSGVTSGSPFTYVCRLSHQGNGNNISNASIIPSHEARSLHVHVEMLTPVSYTANSLSGSYVVASVSVATELKSAGFSSLWVAAGAESSSDPAFSSAGESG